MTVTIEWNINLSGPHLSDYFEVEYLVQVEEAEDVGVLLHAGPPQ